MHISDFEVVCSNCGAKIRDGEQDCAEYCGDCKHIEDEMDEDLEKIKEKNNN